MAPFGTISPPTNMVVSSAIKSSISGRQLRTMIKEGAVVLMRKKKWSYFPEFQMELNHFLAFLLKSSVSSVLISLISDGVESLIRVSRK